MTERKPTGQPFESWVDRQIREAQERGAFEDLPGKGKPIPGAGQPYDEMWWVKDKLRREDVSYLPPTLAVRKAVEKAMADALAAPNEAQVRRIIAEVNRKIAAALARPPDGLPLNLKPLNADDVVAQWRSARRR